MACMCVIHPMVYMGQVLNAYHVPQIEVINTWPTIMISHVPVLFESITTKNGKLKVSYEKLEKMQNTLKGYLKP